MSVWRHIIRASCSCRSWNYEWCAVFGISLGTNLMAWRLTSTKENVVIWPWTVLVWLCFGAAALWYAQAFRRFETHWEEQKLETDIRTVKAWTWSKLNKDEDERWLQWVFGAMAVLLGAGTVLMVVALNSL